MITSIEAPFTLLQKPVKVIFFDSLKSTQMTLRLVPKILEILPK